MDTVSLLASRLALGASPSMLLAGLLVSIGLILLVAAGLDVAGPFLQPDGDPMMAPFRWRAVAPNLA
jgi:hypothetical protein